MSRNIPKKHDKYPPDEGSSIRRASALVSLALILCLLVREALFDILLRLFPQGEATGYLAATVSSVVGLCAMGALLPYDRKRAGCALQTDRKNPAALFGVLLGLTAVSGAVTAAFVRLLSAAGLTFSESVMPHGAAFAVWALSSVIVMPIAEETAFHGRLMNYLLRFGEDFALIAATVLFALFHVTPTKWPNAVIAGGFIGWAVIKTGSLGVGIGLHAANNLMAAASVMLRAGGFSPEKYFPAPLLFAIAVGLAAGRDIKKRVPVPEKDSLLRPKLKGFFIALPMLTFTAAIFMMMREGLV